MGRASIRTDQQIVDLEMKMFSAIAGREPTIGPPPPPEPNRFVKASELAWGWCSKQLPPASHPAMKRLIDAKHRLLRSIHA